MGNTPNLNIPMPDPSADVDDEFYRLQQAWMLVDAALYQLILAVAGKSNTGHTHAIDQINGLVSALQNKMDASKTFKIGDLTDVVGAADAQLNYVLSKNIDGKFTFASALSLLGNHEHTIGQVQNLTEALNARLLKSGGIMTGALGAPNIVLNGVEDSYQQLIFNKNDVARFNLHLDPVGNLNINRYSNTGAYLGLAFWIERLTGKVQLEGTLVALGGIDVRQNLLLPSSNGDARISLGNGDGASYTTYNTILKGWWGMAMQTYDGSINGYYDFRAGVWDVKGGFKVNGNVVPHGGFKASAAEIIAGTANKFPDAAAVRAVVASFLSGNQSYVVNGLGSVAHGLGTKPQKLSSQLVCTTAANGYSVGDEIEMASGSQPYPGSGSFGIHLWADATNIFWKTGSSGIVVLNKSNGASEGAQSANWQLRLKAAL
ncbi:hypothetical protein [Agrobacterium rosae]|uniref:hypothetical protein n=1 Tax=Agrobacterium rosae TaxID=1972867 RepID=UPI003B9E81CE